MCQACAPGHADRAGHGQGQGRTDRGRQGRPWRRQAGPARPAQGPRQAGGQGIAPCTRGRAISWPVVEKQQNQGRNRAHGGLVPGAQAQKNPARGRVLRVECRGYRAALIASARVNHRRMHAALTVCCAMPSWAAASVCVSPCTSTRRAAAQALLSRMLVSLANESKTWAGIVGRAIMPGHQWRGLV